MALLAAGIAAGAGLLGQGIGAYSAGRMNKRAERFARESYNTQRKDALSDWAMQNAYNDPSAQMARLKAAGLNPNLVYGTGAQAQATSAPRGSNRPQPNYKVPTMDLGSVALQGMQLKQMQANIARTEAETQAIQSRTTGTDFQNQLNQKIGLDNMNAKFNAEYNKLSADAKQKTRDLEIYLEATTPTAEGKPNLKAVDAIKARFDQARSEANNAKVRGDIYAAERAIKNFEVGLTKMGISPNSPYWLKSVITLGKSLGLGQAWQDFKSGSLENKLFNR